MILNSILAKVSFRQLDIFQELFPELRERERHTKAAYL